MTRDGKTVQESTVIIQAKEYKLYQIQIKEGKKRTNKELSRKQMWYVVIDLKCMIRSKKEFKG